MLAQGDDIVPIPGTRSVAHLKDDLAAWDLQLPADVLQRAGELINTATVSGHRYAEQGRREVDTEDVAA